MKKIILVLSLFFLVAQAKSQIAKNIWKPYTTNTVIDTTGFAYVDSMFTLYKEPKVENLLGFAIFKIYENYTLLSKKSNDILIGVVTPFLLHDTLDIKTGIGFFGGIGVSIKVKNNFFSSALGYSADHVKIYKFLKHGSEYISNIWLSPVTQSLKFFGNPTFKNKEIVVGQLEAEYEPFFEKEWDGDRLKKVKIKIVFSCPTINLDQLLEEKNKNKKPDEKVIL